MSSMFLAPVDYVFTGPGSFPITFGSGGWRRSRRCVGSTV